MAHRKTIRHYHEPGHLHEFTFSCYRRRPLLTNDDWREMLSRRIDEAGKETNINLVAFVFMPEHVHLLAYPIEPKPALGLYLARIKQPFSKQIKEILVEHRSRLDGPVNCARAAREEMLSVLAGRSGIRSQSLYGRSHPGFRRLYSPQPRRTWPVSTGC